MFYFRCPTCRTEYANKILTWKEELDKICHNGTSRAEKDVAQAQLLDKLEVKEPCCRMRFITYFDKTIIK